MFDVITFDCYGTLIDWEAGIARAFVDAAWGDGVRLDARVVRDAYAEIEPAVQAQGYRKYRDVLETVALGVARRLGWPLTPERARFLPESLPTWPPFPDTNLALERLKADGYALGILSNVDDDLLARTLEHLTVRFDILVTAEQVRSYKPAAAHFERSRGLVGGRRWLHVGGSAFHDVEPACALGIPVVWVNRGGGRPGSGAPPLAEVSDLVGLVAWLTAGQR